MGYNVVKCDEKFSRIVYHLALLGATDKELCDALGVSMSTLSVWKTKNPEFKEALQKGRVMADMKVAEALFLNTQDRFVEIEENHVYRGEVIKTTKKIFIQGDKWAQAQWLSKRRKGEWTEKGAQNIQFNQYNIATGGFDFSGMSDEELKMLENIGYKTQKSQQNGHSSDISDAIIEE